MQVSGEESSGDFDALVVCNGHYSEPRYSNVKPWRRVGVFRFFGAFLSGGTVCRSVKDCKSMRSLHHTVQLTGQ